MSKVQYLPLRANLLLIFQKINLAPNTFTLYSWTYKHIPMRVKGDVAAVEPNEARLTISAACVPPGVSACGDCSHPSPLYVPTLALITGCNQQAVRGGTLLQSADRLRPA